MVSFLLEGAAGGEHAKGDGSFWHFLMTVGTDLFGFFEPSG